MYEEFYYDFADITVFDRQLKGESIRFMAVGDGHQSVTFNAPEKRCEITLAYMFSFDDIVGSMSDCKNVLLMGGGGFSYPKYFLSAYPDKNMDVIELYPEIHRLAQKYFYLDEAVEKFDPEHKRLNVIYGDAYKYLKTCGKKYDIIFNDTYNGDKAPRAMFSMHTIKNVKNLLTPNGVYAVNVFRMGSDLEKRAQAMRRILDKHFAETRIVTDKIKPISSVVRNCVVIGKSPVSKKFIS